MPIGIGLGLNLTLLQRLLGSVSAYVAYALAVDFDSAEYFVGGTQYNPLSTAPGYTFTRSGIQGAVDASGAVAFFAANVPAINGYGYHAYGALTNQTIRSQELDNAAWTKVSLTVTADQTAAPDGLTTADLITLTGATTAKYLHDTPSSYTAGTAYTFSFFAKAGSHQYVQCVLGGPTFTSGSFCNFDLSLGVVGTSISCTGYIVMLPNGWYRCVVVATCAATGSPVCFVAGVTASNSAQLAATASTGTFYLWQYQAIAGNFPDGGPIITTGAATASIGESLLKQNAKADGTALTDQDMLIWCRAGPLGDKQGTQYYLNINDGTFNNRITFYRSTTGVFTYVEVAAVGVYAPTVETFGAGQSVILVLRRKAGQWRGGKIVSGVITWAGLDTTGGFPTGMTTLTNGNYLSGTVPANSAIQGGFIKNGTFDTDAKVLAAVAETA